MAQELKKNNPELSPRSFVGAIRIESIKKYQIMKLIEESSWLLKFKRIVAWLLWFRFNYLKRDE